MTTIIRVTVAVLLAFILSSCNFDINFGEGIRGNGNIQEEDRTVTADFTTISGAEGLDIIITQGSPSSISVKADENVIGLILTEIKNGTLRIHADKNIGRATKTIYVTAPEISNISGSSGANLRTKNTITTQHLSLNSSSGAAVIVTATTDEINADSSSGADIQIKGTTNHFTASASSGSDIKASDLEAKICNASASSGADIRVQVSENLSANASSGADIYHQGNARLEIKKSSSGSVHSN